MRKILFAAAAVALSAMAAPAVAQQPASEAQTAPEVDPMDQVVCQRDAMVGSRVAKRRTCMTRREWVRTQNATRDGLEGHLRAATGGAARE